MFRPWANMSPEYSLASPKTRAGSIQFSLERQRLKIQAARKAPCTALVGRKHLGTRAEISMSALLSPTNRSYLLLT